MEHLLIPGMQDGQKANVRALHGSEVGDLFMSLIHTCELAGVNPFDYLTELQRHARELAASPSAWMPWNYLEQTQTGHNQ